MRAIKSVRQFSSLYTWGQYSAGLGWGANSQGKLLEVFGTPKEVMQNVKQVAMGRDHSALVTEQGVLMTAGCGDAFQLGNGASKELQTDFQEVAFFQDKQVLQVDCDDSYTVVLTQEGHVYEMGVRRHGLFMGDYAQTPSQVQIGEKVVQVAAGKSYGMAITASGKVFSWGAHDYGCQGDGKVGFKYSAEENLRFKELREKKGLTAKKVALGGNSTVVLLSDGSLWSCGQNYKGQLGLRAEWGKRTDQFNEVLKPMITLQFQGKVKDFAVSPMVTVVLTEEGNVFYSGFGSSYQLVQDERAVNATSIAVTDEGYYIVQKDGQMLMSHQLNPLSPEDTEVQAKDYFPQVPAALGGSYGLSFALL